MRCLRIDDEPVLGEVGEPFHHPCARTLCNACAGIVERDVAAAAGKDYGPGAANEPRSDNGYARLHIHSTLLISPPSCAGLARASTSLRRGQDVDGRDKPGHDERLASALNSRNRRMG
jgi:hypothetical protein